MALYYHRHASVEGCHCLCLGVIISSLNFVMLILAGILVQSFLPFVGIELLGIFTPAMPLRLQSDANRDPSKYATHSFLPSHLQCRQATADSVLRRRVLDIIVNQSDIPALSDNEMSFSASAKSAVHSSRRIIKTFYTSHLASEISIQPHLSPTITVSLITVILVLWTPINGYEWPVPIPKDTNLDLIRIEMLNAGAEYAWLDVLCLRQVGGRREDLRAEEWKVDVPTIGYVYRRMERGVYYFNGLGRPLRMKMRDFESDRSWFKRVWTLQEYGYNRIIGGDMGDDNIMEEEVRTEFDRRLLALEEISGYPDVWNALSHMRDRVRTNPVDRIAGLVYLTDGVENIPAYHEMQSMEDAWTALVDVLSGFDRSALFFTYPRPGNRNKVWRPSWNQVMNNVEVLPSICGYFQAEVQWTEDTDSDWVEEVSILSGYVQGLAEGSYDGKHRQGELIVTDDTGTRHTFKIIAHHQYQIPDGLYALLGSCLYSYDDGKLMDEHWVVRRRLLEQKFEKVSVFQIADEEVKRLDDLQITMEEKIFLV